MRFLFRLIKYIFIAVISLSVLTGVALGGLVYYLVVIDPGPEMNEQHISSILGRESPVFYNNGLDKIGVLFQDAHRQYITYDNIIWNRYRISVKEIVSSFHALSRRNC